jgi:aromatic ring-opening dioxygenase catalytic subunit (LigB family)
MRPLDLLLTLSLSLAKVRPTIIIPTSIPKLQRQVCTTTQPTIYPQCKMARGAVISLSHGGGPMPLMGDPGHRDIVKSLKTRVPKLLRLGTPEAPRAIVLITAHWSEDHPTISNGSKHKLYYDYYNFPAEMYKLKYDAPGSPDVAQEVFNALKSEGLKPKMDSERGTFVQISNWRPMRTD